jgi:uncharacterized Tic20 family protein
MSEYEKNDRLWAMSCHLSALLGYCIPLGNVFAPLIIWAIKRDKSSYIDQQGKEAVNFQISISIVMLIAIALIVIVVGALLIPLIGIFNLIMIIFAAVKTANGENFRYPLTWRFVK